MIARKLTAIFLTVSLVLTYANPVFAKRGFFVSGDEDESHPYKWSRGLLLFHARQAAQSTALLNPSTVAGVVAAVIDDPYYNSSDSWYHGYDDMWDGNLDSFLNIDEFGNEVKGQVSTGTELDGTASGCPFGHWAYITYGSSEATSYRWVEYAHFGDKGAQRHFYGLSEKLTAPGGVIPEPSTLAIWSLLAVFGLTVAWRRRRK